MRAVVFSTHMSMYNDAMQRFETSWQTLRLFAVASETTVAVVRNEMFFVHSSEIYTCIKTV